MSANTEALRHYEHIHANIIYQDVCYSRHQGNPESHAAYQHAPGTRAKDRQLVLELIQETPRSMKQIADILGRSFNTISGRGSELLALGLVERTGQTVDGSAILRIVV
jgi:predicted HTH transcriptional regulator